MLTTQPETQDAKSTNRCDWLGVYEELLEELPGAWPQTIHQVWEEAAWRPTDLFISYSVRQSGCLLQDE